MEVAEEQDVLLLESWGVLSSIVEQLTQMHQRSSSDKVMQALKQENASLLLELIQPHVQHVEDSGLCPLFVEYCLGILFTAVCSLIR